MFKKRLRKKFTLKFQNKNKFLVVLIILVLGIILINFLKFPMTGKITVSYESDLNFSNGTFTNISLINGVIKLNKTLTPVGEYNNASSLGDPYDLFVVGDYAYVTSTANDSLTILDISNKSNPFFVGYYNDSDPPYSLDYAYGIFVVGDYAYTLSKNDECLTILNISNKSNPTPVGSYNDSEALVSIHSVYVVGDYAYVTSFGNDSLRIFNVTNKTNITFTGSYINSALPYSLDGARELFVLDDYAYVISSLDDALTILNISNKSNPTPVGDYNNSEPPYSLNSAYGVFVLDDYAYVTASGNDSLTILDISNKSNPTPVGDYNDSDPPFSIDSPRTVFVVGDYVYVTSWNDDSLTILNTSNKTNIIPIESYNNSALPYSLDASNSLHVVGDYIYVTTYSDGITILTFGFFQSGIYESEIINSTLSVTDWVNVSWNETQPNQTNLSLAFRSCDDSSCSGENWSSWNENSPSTLSGISNNQYFQFKAKFETTNISQTSELNSVSIHYVCAESWTYSEWTTCVSSLQTRTGTDANSCGTTVNRLALSQSCTVESTTSGGSAATTSLPTTTATWDVVEPGTPLEMDITNVDIGITDITVDVSETVTDVSIKVTKIDVVPLSDIKIDLNGDTYQSFQIDVTGLNDTNIEEVTIEFKVNKTWIDEENGTTEEIILYRKEDIGNKWDELTTTFVSSDDDDYYYFLATSPSFSSFTIALKIARMIECIPEEKKCIGNVLQQCSANGMVWETIETCDYKCSRNKCVAKFEFSVLIFYIITVVLSVGIFVLIFVGYRYFSKRKLVQQAEKRIEISKNRREDYLEKS